MTKKKQNGVLSVSIITVNQIKRSDTIKITAELIDSQTYKNIIEWVIVEGSKNLEESLLNEFEVNNLSCKVPIKYIKGYTIDSSGEKIFNGDHLGELRNKGNEMCSGDITVCMDDDDYYPPTRVEHAVKMLSASKCLIAGCSEKYLYDYCLKRLVKFKQFGPNHSTNDCMAWKKEYLLENKHDPTKDMAEEASFTNSFKNPMVQLDAKHCIVGNSHLQNTFSKKEICVLGCIGIHPMVIDCKHNKDHLTEVTDIIKPEIFERYCELFDKPKDSIYDIVYFTGGTSIEWDPTDKALGGSEQAVVNLANEWTKLGKKVAVYGKLKKTGKVADVDYHDWKTFPYNDNHNTLILWRMSGVNCLLQFPVKAKNLFVDFHDNNFVFRFDYLRYADKIDKIFFKSDFHLDYYCKHFKLTLPENRYYIIPNGIRVEQFAKQPTEIVKNPFRFCYCSCYTRGLMELLMFVWPVIYHHEPRAELHVYYGMHGVQDQEFIKRMTVLLAQPGVMDHSRQPMELIIREKWASQFQLYITDCVGEIDCISVRESLCTGCIPLISKSGVFDKRDGLHFSLDKTEQNYQTIAHGILNLLKKPDFIKMCSEKFKESPTITTWEQTAKEWISKM